MAFLMKPDLVLRLGVAGNRSLPDEAEKSLRLRLQAVYTELNRHLTVLAPGLESAAKPSPITTYYSDNPPILRLVSGLADGADQLACDTLLADNGGGVTREIAAILPFETETYRDHSPVQDKARFERLRGHCRYLLELDGRYLPDPHDDAPADSFPQHCRARAYRAQSFVLLRQIDLLIAVDNPERLGRAGGTQETMRHAIAEGIPVLYLPINRDAIELLRTPTELEHALSPILISPLDVSSAWKETLRRWVYATLAQPLVENADTDAPVPLWRDSEHAFLANYFGAKTPTKTRRGKLWDWFQRQFKSSHLDEPGMDLECAPFTDFRRRASALNYYYVGLYRGTFLLNFSLAVLAVMLAVASLIVLLGSSSPEVANHAVGMTPPAELIPAAVAAVSDTADTHSPALDTTLLLLVLGAAKLLVVFYISRNTEAANRAGWNDCAIDYRYLSERLRTMLYLPRLGSLRPPMPRAPQYASRAQHYSLVEWLFQAIVRHAPPELALATQSTDAAAANKPLRLIAPAAVEAFQSHWIENQHRYHRNNAATMSRMQYALETCGSWLSKAVVWVVMIDISILGFDLIIAGLSRADMALPFSIAWLHASSPWLLFFVAVLPAAVASLNGIRFQSECRRLADRSEVMVGLLDELGDQTEALAREIAVHEAEPEKNPGSWTPEALKLAEYCARTLLDEVAEWSILYTKEVPDPG